MIDPLSSKTTGYHLFFEPTGTLAEELVAVIRDLSSEYGGPVFKPHVTLLARIPGDENQVLKHAEALADTIAPFSIQFGEMGMDDTFYRALYLRAVNIDNVANAHAQANAIFGMSDEGTYMPHLSLLYGNYDKGRKARTASALVLPKDISFEANTLHLYRTQGEVGVWQKMREFPLQGKK